jgi:hypothetical protein
MTLQIPSPLQTLYKIHHKSAKSIFMIHFLFLTPTWLPAPKFLASELPKETFALLERGKHSESSDLHNHAFRG